MTVASSGNLLGRVCLLRQSEPFLFFYKLFLFLFKQHITMADRYSFSLTTFSPSGKLVQIEYALNAVSGGVTSVGIKGN